MNHSSRNSTPQRSRYPNQERSYGEPGQPDYSFAGQDSYSSPYDQEDDGWRENAAQRNIDDYRRTGRSEQQGDYPYDARQYSRELGGWRDAPEGWDRYAREQRGSAYNFYSGRGQPPGQRHPTQSRSHTTRGPWAQRGHDFSNFPDFNPQNDRYVYPGASSAWDEDRSQSARGSYRGYPYARPDFERTWLHHPSHDENEYLQGDYGQTGLGNYGRGAFGLSSAHAHRGPDDNSYRSIGEYYSRHSYAGRGPKGYERSDQRLQEDICERLERDPYIDASEVSVAVKSGIVTLEGSVNQRMQKHRAEDLVEACPGVKDIQNRITVSRHDQWNLGESDRGNGSQSADTQPHADGDTSGKQQNVTRQ